MRESPLYGEFAEKAGNFPKALTEMIHITSKTVFWGSEMIARDIPATRSLLTGEFATPEVPFEIRTSAMRLRKEVWLGY